MCVTERSKTHLYVAFCLALHMNCVFSCVVLNLLLWSGLQAKKSSPLSLCFLALCLALTLAAAATPVCAFVTVATNSKARQRCSIAVDVKATRGGLALQHAHEHICAHTGIHTSMHMFKHEPKFMYIHMSVHEHVRGHRYVEVGVPTLSQQGGGDGEAARILSPHYPHTGKTV